MALFPPGFRTVAQKIKLPGFKAGQKFGKPADAAVAAPTDAAALPLAPAPPPSAILDASNAITSAKIAAERQRKRAAGGSVKVAAPAASPKAVLSPKSLVGY